MFLKGRRVDGITGVPVYELCISLPPSSDLLPSTAHLNLVDSVLLVRATRSGRFTTSAELVSNDQHQGCAKLSPKYFTSSYLGSEYRNRTVPLLTVTQSLHSNDAHN